jgi:hypothetical protein
LAAEEHERRVLVEELVERVSIFPHHLEITISGAPPLHDLYQEAGLKQSALIGVGASTRRLV